MTPKLYSLATLCGRHKTCVFIHENLKSHAQSVWEQQYCAHPVT